MVCVSNVLEGGGGVEEGCTKNLNLVLELELELERWVARVESKHLKEEEGSVE